MNPQPRYANAGLYILLNNFLWNIQFFRLFFIMHRMVFGTVFGADPFGGY